MKILQKIYFVWFTVGVVVFFLLLYPFIFVFLLSKKTHFLAHFMLRVWGVFAYLFSGLPWKTIKNGKSPQTAVYCANHFSYTDIPTLFLSIPGFFSIIGKADLVSIPLFGYMFKKMYIAVDRSHGKNRYQAYEKGLEMIDKGRSMVIYPEGGIRTENPPAMTSFKDGAFKIAIEKKVPIIPVTIYNNWIILREGSWFMKWRPSIVKIHSPIDTKNLSLQDVDALKQQVFTIIQNELNTKFT